jgi:stage II sporulation protein D
LLFVLMIGGAGAGLVWWGGYSGAARQQANAPALQIPRSPAADAFSPTVRVNLTPTPKRALTVRIDGRYQVRPAGSREVLGSGNRLGPSEVSATAVGLRIGEREYPVSRLEIVPGSSPSVWVGDHQYRGSVRIYRQADRTLLAVNHLPLEDYLAGVVDSEMPAAFPQAARQAQAIVARTYALYQMTRAHPLFDLFASTQSQKYLGFQYREPDGRRLAGESESSRAAVRATGGMALVHDAELFCTYYSAVCGGRTTPGDQVFSDAAPPLQSVACDWCEAARLYRWTSRASKADLSADLKRHLAGSGRSFGTLLSLRRTQGAAYDHRAIYRAGDGRRDYEFSAVDLRRCLRSIDLHSPHFDVRDNGSSLVFDGHGHGHGVGLCQWGARGQALAGREALEIVRHYYPRATVVAMAPE